MEGSEKNSWNPDFDSKLKGIYLSCKLDNLSIVTYGSYLNSSLNGFPDVGVEWYLFRRRLKGFTYYRDKR